MHKIINEVKTVTETTTEDINNDNLENMDTTFVENMDLMQQQHTTATIIIAKTKDDSIKKLHTEKNVLIVNISKEISASPSIKDARNSFISDIAESGSKTIHAINEIVISSQVTYDTNITNFNSIYTTFINETQKTHEIMIKSLNDCCDGAFTDLSSFQSKIQVDIKKTLCTIIQENNLKLRDDLDIIVIDHNAHLLATTSNMKQ